MIFLNLKRTCKNSLIEYAEALHNLKYQHCTYDLYGYLTADDFYCFNILMNISTHKTLVDGIECASSLQTIFCSTDKDTLVWLLLIANEFKDDEFFNDDTIRL